MDVMQVAGVGAAALVAEMAKSTWESMRAATTRILRRDGAQGAAQVMRLVDTAQQQLVDSPENERDAIEERLRSELLIQLAAFLLRHPDAAADLQQLGDTPAGPDEGAGSRNNVHSNTNSQVVISGGNINASGGFHYRSPEAGQ